MTISQEGPTNPRSPARALLAGAGLLFLVLPALGCGKSERAPALVTDDLEVSEAFHDFGDVPHGATPKHIFYLRNVSEKKIVLNKVMNSCSCAGVGLRVLDAAGKPRERKVYDPPKRLGDGTNMVTWLEKGEQLEIEIKIISSQRAPKDSRENAQTELLFDDLQMGRVKIGYDFHIVPRLLIKPSHLIRLGSFTKRQDVHEGIELSPLPGQPPFKILRVEGLGAAMTLKRIKATQENGHRYALKVGPLGKTNPSYQKTLLFHTDIDGGYVMPVTLVGSCIPNLSFNLASGILFGRFSFADATHRFLETYYGGQLEDPQIKVSIDVVLDGKNKDVSSFFKIVHEKKSRSEYLTTILYTGGLEGRSFQGAILIRSNDPEHRETKLKLSGFNRGPR